MKTALTGIKPTATPHLGNYLGAIKPALRLSENYKSNYFIADYHALTSLKDPNKLKSYVYDVAATWLAAGLDPERTLLYRQSDVPQVFELSWVLSCLLATGQLERGHAYKDALAQNKAPNAGIFFYPVLMAADILLFDTHIVPVGKDQKQHVELARDVATRFNHTYGENLLVIPEALINDELLVPGTDGQKMSKSYGNTLPLFASAKELKSMVMKIKTGSEALEAPKKAEGSTVFELYCTVATQEEQATLKKKLETGGYGWGHAKLDLYEALEAELGPKREKYNAIRADEQRIEAILQHGSERAMVIAQNTIAGVRRVTGID